jgi:hypothetical protein
LRGLVDSFLHPQQATAFNFGDTDQLAWKIE